MCISDAPSATCARNQQPLFRILCSLDSFSSLQNKHQRPETSSLIATGLVFLLILISSEQLWRWWLAGNTHWHELMVIERNRQIIARHMGVDALACLVVFVCGWRSKHLHADLFASKTQQGKKESGSSSLQATYASRLFTYQPSGFRIALLFFVYQIKNLYDSYVWSDGPEYLFHHVFSLVTAWGCMFPNMGSYYAIFFFGMCELSTAVVCILANFDVDQGVPGLGDAMPYTKIGVGIVFVFLFVTCRCILWPFYSYHFSRDVLTALKNEKGLTIAQKRWMKFFLVSLSGLSVLQVAWLGQIFVVAQEEFIKIGWLSAA
ncbi:hypothetical protein MPSEU_000264000 [Mayamaea pseudoterrestris]|nr:hypothetical protein MPSEU_000264000 [Mayamaea pseudoterrestris]